MGRFGPIEQDSRLFPVELRRYWVEHYLDYTLRTKDESLPHIPTNGRIPAYELPQEDRATLMDLCRQYGVAVEREQQRSKYPEIFYGTGLYSDYLETGETQAPESVYRIAQRLFGIVAERVADEPNRIGDVFEDSRVKAAIHGAYKTGLELLKDLRGEGPPRLPERWPDER